LIIIAGIIIIAVTSIVILVMDYVDLDYVTATEGLEAFSWQVAHIAYRA